jgi:hypothetical protein
MRITLWADPAPTLILENPVRNENGVLLSQWQRGRVVGRLTDNAVNAKIKI